MAARLSGGLQLSFEELNLVLELLNFLGVAFAHALLTVFHLKFLALLFIVVDLFVFLICFVLQFFDADCVSTLELVDLSVFLLVPAEEDSLLLKLEFALILRLQQPEFVFLLASLGVGDVYLLDELLSLNLVKVYFVRILFQLFLEPGVGLGGVESFTLGCLSFHLDLLHLLLNFEDVVAVLGMLVFVLLNCDFSILQVALQGPGLGSSSVLIGC